MRIILSTIFTAATLTALLPMQAQAEGGCGVGWHREVVGLVGPCVRDREVVVVPAPVVVDPAPGVVVVEPRRRVCPPGFHLGPEGRECHRN